MQRTITIDHGNRLIKTANHIFPESYVESGYLPGIGSDVLKHNGKTYTLVDQSLPVLNDKTEDERYFILTLFALGKELEEDAETLRKLSTNPNDFIKVNLLVGLPLQHYETYRKRFQRYFTQHQEPIIYELNNKSYKIKITSAHVYPQAFAAALTAHNEIKHSNTVNVIDIGGFTVDCLQLNNFRPNMTLCTSLYLGVRTLFDKINEQARATGGKDIADNIIESILNNEPHALAEYSEKRINLVQNTAYTYADRMLAEVAQKGFDLEEDRTVFMGGGAILMKKYILESNRAKKSLFIDDVRANAKGYAILHEMKNHTGSHARNIANGGE
ncbi:MAG: ParM/StbA family protein [Defluviitaleaceae bacterium]|nr:ParM/StbA family protein [Defluviitaleaceae bacterium]